MIESPLKQWFSTESWIAKALIFFNKCRVVRNSCNCMTFFIPLLV